MSGDIPPPEDEDAGRKMTSPWRSERVICLRVRLDVCPHILCVL